jgi:hypothetical protein
MESLLAEDPLKCILAWRVKDHDSSSASRAPDFQDELSHA